MKYFFIKLLFLLSFSCYKDKIVCWHFFYGTGSLIFILLGVKMLLGTMTDACI